MTHCILLAWDGSDCAKRALDYAVRVAKARGDCSVHAVYAQEAPVLYGEVAVYVSPEKMEQLQRAHGETVLEEAAQLLRGAGVPFQTEALTGPVGKVLADRASTLGCDAIVMGTHGRGAVGGLVMGSVATKVVHFSQVPVTLVK